MRFCSTAESAATGEITFVAIVETLLAAALAVLLVKVLGSSTHIIVGALIVPFLLLRSDSSTAKAFEIFDSGYPRLATVFSFLQRLYQRLPAALRAFTFIFLWLPLFLLVLGVIKIIATVATVISSPRETVLAIPGNWVRIALATDFRHPPEFLAGVETAGLAEDAPVTVRNLRYEEIRGQITSGTGSAFFKRVSLFAIYAPTLIYRLFIKSTSLIYFPLIWLTELPLTANSVLSLPMERVRRWFAYALLLITLSPLVISFHVPESLVTVRDQVIFTYLIPMDRIAWWHIARVVAVGVTIGLYFYARKVDENDDEQQPEKVRWNIAWANRLRAACGVFTMGCFILILLAL